MKRAEVRSLLERAGIRPRREAGQNFLVEENLAAAIARDGCIEPDDVVLEIGPGLGILTRALCPLAHEVVSVEVDGKLFALVRELLADRRNLTLVRADVLANKNALNQEVLDLLRERLGEGRALRVVANLPYNIATPLVVLLLSAELPLASMTVMVQLEAAQRFVARRGDPQYGAVSLLCAALCERIELVRKVPRDVFMPRPKVQSAVVRFRPAPERRRGFAQLSAVVRALFNYRRKTLAKAVRSVVRREPSLSWLEGALEEAGLDSRMRAEEVPLEGFRALAARAPQATEDK